MVFNNGLRYNYQATHQAMETLDIPLLPISDRQDLFSVSYVRAVVAAAGFNFSKTELDRNSDDLHIEHLQRDEFVPYYGRLLVQIKCTYAHTISEDDTIHYPLPIRNYNHLRMERIEPRILIVVLVPRPELTEEPWVECVERNTLFRYRAYWHSLMGLEARDNQETVTVKVPASNSFDVDAVRMLMHNMVAQGRKRL